MHKSMTLTELKKHQPSLLAAFLVDHSEVRACELANKILMDLDNFEERFGESYDPEKEEAKRKLAKKAKAKIRSMAGLRRD